MSLTPKNKDVLLVLLELGIAALIELLKSKRANKKETGS